MFFNNVSVITNVKYIEDPFPHAIIDNFFTEEELKSVWKELEFLTDSSKLLDETKTGSAYNADGSLKKVNYGMFLDQIYTDRNLSNILNLSKKVFDVKTMDFLYRKHWVFRYLRESTRDTTLLSYYENNNHYDTHFDYASITILTHLFKEPKQFTGGDLVFQDNYQLPLVNNRTILFPSVIDHAVTEIKMDSDNKLNGNGRYCISKFIHIK